MAPKEYQTLPKMDGKINERAGKSPDILQVKPKICYPYNLSGHLGTEVKIVGCTLVWLVEQHVFTLDIIMLLSVSLGKSFRNWEAT